MSTATELELIIGEIYLKIPQITFIFSKWISEILTFDDNLYTFQLETIKKSLLKFRKTFLKENILRPDLMKQKMRAQKKN